MTNTRAAVFAKGGSSLACSDCNPLVTSGLGIINLGIGWWSRRCRRRLIRREALFNILEPFQDLRSRRIGRLRHTDDIFLIGSGRY